MIVKATQAPRQLAVFTPLGDDELLLRRLDGREEISRLFHYELEMLSANEAIDPKKLVGRNVTFTIQKPDGTTRDFNGFVRRFSYDSQTDQGTTYRAAVVPWLWFLTNTADCRIFQNKTAPQIIEQIFTDLGFGSEFVFELHGRYAPREYCVQYRETDFDFVSRLMEEEGIFYFFRHKNGKHTLVMADSPTSYFDIDDDKVVYADPDHSGDLVEQITAWQHEKSFRPGRWAQTDYNFKRPRANLMRNESSVVELRNNRAFEIYDYPGGFERRRVGQSLTRVRMEEQEAGHDVASGSATYRSFAPGGRFTVKSHRTRAEIGKAYVLTAVEHTASVGGSYITGTGRKETYFETRFTCIPASVPFRPRRITPRPVVEGPQTAVVVGPKGEEIYTDEFARVKCQFHWDREGKRDENSSCWIRVSQTHAGKGWGSIDLPRIGEEVIVSFLEGDPDRPIIKGRVYNDQARPPFKLPGEMTRSGGKSDTHKGSGYNEMSTDDTAGQEQIRTNAQYNMDTAVGNNQTLAVGVDRTEDIGNNESLTVAVDSSTEVGNNATVTVGNSATYEVANNIVIEAGTAITLACGASTIHMNQAGVITISGQFVTSAATAMNNTVAPMTEIAGSNMLNQAGLVTLMLGGLAKVNGGTSAEVTGAATSARGGVVVVKGAPILLGEVGAPIASLPSPPSAGSGSAAGGAGGAAGAGGPSSGSGAAGGGRLSGQTSGEGPSITTTTASAEDASTTTTTATPSGQEASTTTTTTTTISGEGTSTTTPTSDTTTTGTTAMPQEQREKLDQLHDATVEAGEQRQSAIERLKNAEGTNDPDPLLEKYFGIKPGDEGYDERRKQLLHAFEEADRNAAGQEYEVHSERIGSTPAQSGATQIVRGGPNNRMIDLDAAQKGGFPFSTRGFPWDPDRSNNTDIYPPFFEMDKERQAETINHELLHNTDVIPGDKNRTGAADRFYVDKNGKPYVRDKDGNIVHVKPGTPFERTTNADSLSNFALEAHREKKKRKP